MHIEVFACEICDEIFQDEPGVSPCHDLVRVCPGCLGEHLFECRACAGEVAGALDED